jgi:hypothetical protein
MLLGTILVTFCFTNGLFGRLMQYLLFVGYGTSSSTVANSMLGVFVLFAVVYPGHYLPPKFLAWWLSTRKLRNEAKSLPPAYNEATILCLSTERGSEQC